MISRLTIFSLLFGLLLGLGIYIDSQSERDRCSVYPSGGVRPASEYVITGNREVEVPCDEWFLRQPLIIQILAVADVLAAVIFAINVLGDLRSWNAWRRSRKRH